MVSDAPGGARSGKIQLTGTVYEDVELAWRAERPDLDLHTACVLMRLEQASHFHELRVQAIAKKMGMTTGDLHVLLALRRAGKPYESRPTDLFRALHVSSAAISRRTMRLQTLGYILRVAANDDGRSELVRLSRQGVQVTDRAITQIAEKTQQLKHDIGLNDDEFEMFDTCLRKLLAFEKRRPARAHKAKIKGTD